MLHNQFKNRYVAILHSKIKDHAGPDEQDTLIQMEAIQSALTALGLEVITIPFTFDFAAISKVLYQYDPIAIFNLVESIEGKARFVHVIPAFLQQIHMPFTGSDERALFISNDKIICKNLLNVAQIPTPAWFDRSTLEQVQSVLNQPYIIKSTIEEGSIGIDKTSIAQDPQALLSIMAQREKQFGGKWFAERYIEGREFNISLLADSRGNPEILPIAEIQFIDFAVDQPRIVDYAAKWDADCKEYHNTLPHFDFAPTDKGLLKVLSELALKCWHYLGLAGYARVDFRVDEHGQPWVLEVNTNPCLAKYAGFFAAAARVNMSYETIIERIIEDALLRSKIN